MSGRTTDGRPRSVKPLKSLKRTMNDFMSAISRSENEAAESDLKKRMILSLILLVVQVSIALGLKPSLSTMVAEAIILAMLIIVNIHCFTDAFQSVRRRQPEKNLLAAIGVILAIGILQLVTAGIVLTTMAVCRYCEAYIGFKLNSHLNELVDTEPSDVGIYRGDILQIDEGDVLPVDGVVLSGETAIDEEIITGERIPARKRDGDPVFAGTRNITSEISIRVTNTGADRAISRLILHISRSIMTRPPKSARYEKVARSFVIVVMAVAVVTAALWIFAGRDVTEAIVNGISILIVANPYAFSVAIPMTVRAAVVRGSEHGILIRSADILEDARDINTIILNKRGTVTGGDPEISDIVSFADSFDLRLAGILEAKAKHPFGKMIRIHAEKNCGDIPEAEIIESIDGRGIVCRYEGIDYIVGNAALMEDRGRSPDSNEAKALFLQGKSLVFFADEEKIIGLIAMRDAPKPESLKAITQMENMGVDVVMVTGDSKQTARAVKNEIGIDRFYADVQPKDKGQIVRSIRRDNDKIVAMIGDGIKDAEALDESDLGIAIGTGRDISIGPADIVLVTDDLHDVVRAMRLARLSVRNLRQSVAFAYAYNILAVICAGGIFATVIDPWLAALFMCASQILVTLNALRIKRSRL